MTASPSQFLFRPVSTENLVSNRVVAQQKLLPSYVTLRELCVFSTMSRSSVYDKLDAKSPRHDPSFPRPVKLGKSRIAFNLSEIEHWLAQRTAQSTLPLV